MARGIHYDSEIEMVIILKAIKYGQKSCHKLFFDWRTPTQKSFQDSVEKQGNISRH